MINGGAAACCHARCAAWHGAVHVACQQGTACLMIHRTECSSSLDPVNMCVQPTQRSQQHTIGVPLTSALPPCALQLQDAMQPLMEAVHAGPVGMEQD